MADIVKLIYKGDEMAQWGGSSTPNADTTTIWSVRVATQVEYTSSSDTWSNWEFLILPKTQIRRYQNLQLKWSTTSQTVSAKWSSAEIALNNRWIYFVQWRRIVRNWTAVNSLSTEWSITKIGGTEVNMSWDYEEFHVDTFYCNSISWAKFVLTFNEWSYDFDWLQSSRKKIFAWTYITTDRNAS